MKKIVKGDKVVAIAGRDKGKQGTVLEILDNDRALVEGVNMVKKHVRPNPNKGETGGIIDREAPIHVSNLALMNPSTNKADRVGFKTMEDGKKVRFFKSNGEVADI